MEKEVVKHHQQQQQQHNSHNNSNTTVTTTTTTNLRERHIIGEGLIRPPQSADFVLKWGNRKRLRCMKIQVKDETTPVHRTTVRVDRRVIRSDNNNSNNNNNVVSGLSHPSNGHFNLRQRPASPARTPQRVLRNSENGTAMKGHHNHQSNGGVRGLASPERGEKKGGGGGGAHENHHNNNYNNNNNLVMINGGRTVSSEKGGSSSGGSDVVVWPPKFVIPLTNKEKEEDFMAIKGSKLPQRPKKRAKLIQRTLNLVMPGAWLCDLTLERYEVREKKTSRKRPRGLKAMGNYMESDSD